MPGTSYSPILSAGTSTPGRLVTTLENFEENASSREKPMLMVELTYILSLTSAENSDLAVPASLMLTVITQMFQLRTLHHVRASTMRAKMVTLWQGDWNDQNRAIVLSNSLDGMISSLQQVETSFSNSLWHMIHELYVPALPSSANMPTGAIAKIQSRIEPQMTWLLMHQRFLNLRNGHTGRFNLHTYVSNHPRDSLSREPQFEAYREGVEENPNPNPNPNPWGGQDT